MDDLRAGAAVAPLEHRPVDHQRRLYVLRGFAHVAPAPLELAQTGVFPPAPVTVFRPGGSFTVERERVKLCV